MDSLLVGLNPEQRAVVEHGDGPLLVEALAGTGKTEALARRVARLVRDGHPGHRILAVTFSRKAAANLTDRLAVLCGPRVVTASTFHRLALRALREENPAYESWTLDEGALYRGVLKKVVGYEGMKWRAADVSYLEELIAVAKVSLLPPGSPEFYALAQSRAQAQVTRFSSHTTPHLVAEAYERAEEERKVRQFHTFDDLVFELVSRLRVDEDCRLRWAARFDHVLQDEAQDQGLDQAELGELLARDHRNYVMAGDPNQSLFSFRGAVPWRMRDFAERWDAKRVVMHRNYRSMRCILEVANLSLAAMAAGTGETPTQLTQEQDGEGEVCVSTYDTFDEEAAAVADRLMAMNSGGQPWRDMAVLFRVNAQSRALEEAFLRARVPYALLSGVGFYLRKEVADLLAYLRLAAGLGAWADFERVVNTPNRYLGKVAVRALSERAAKDLGALTTKRPAAAWAKLCADVADAGLLKLSQNASLAAFGALLSKLAGLILHAAGAPTGSPAALAGAPSSVIQRAADDTAYLNWLAATEGAETTENSRVSNVRELIRAAGKFADALDFLAYVDGVVASVKESQRTGEAADAVSLMTVHRCVAPDTLVETPEGLRPIRAIPYDGTIAAPDGLRRYTGKVSNPVSGALRVRTRSGYEVVATPKHGFTVWQADAHVRKSAEDLYVGDVVRLRVGLTVDAAASPALPPLSCGDVRAAEYSAPRVLTDELAELLGLLVADGTVYRGGFRVVKQYQSVLDRAAALAVLCFGAKPIFGNHDGTPMMEVNSTVLSAWLLSLGGLAPRKKSVPDAVLRAPLVTQRAFLRGLFEDGTVNEAGGHVDHVRLDNMDPALLATVQVMLLRAGIISSRKTHATRRERKITSLYLHGAHARRFGQTIGFMAKEKMARLGGTFGNNTRHSVPVTRDELAHLRQWMTKFELANARARGCVSRHVAEQVLARSEGAAAILADRLLWHYEPVTAVEPTTSDSMCVEVPEGGRFLQNGFDGWNSKGLEFPVVCVVGCNDGVLPHARGDLAEERRLFYVATTRARYALDLTAVRVATVAGKTRPVTPSPFLTEADLDPDEEGDEGEPEEDEGVPLDEEES